MNKIFVSYRRADSAGVAGHIYDELARRFGRSAIFMDVDSIPAGVNFRDYIRDTVSQCGLMLVIIGDRWADIQDANGRRRLDDPNDVVRFELLAANESDLFIIPVQLGRGRQDHPLLLPPALTFLGGLSRSYVDVGASFALDMDFLLLRIERTLSLPEQRHQSTYLELIRAPTPAGLIAWRWFLAQLYVVAIAALWITFSHVGTSRQQIVAAAGWMLPLLVVLLVGLVSTYSVATQWVSCLVVIAAWTIAGYFAGVHLQVETASRAQGVWWTSHVAPVVAAAFGIYGFAINLSLFRRWRGVTVREYTNYGRKRRLNR